MSSAVLRMAIPLTLASVIDVLYNIVDRMYIGHIPEVGSAALTGLGVAAPLLTVVSSFTALCCSGGAPLCSIERGKGDVDEAERIMGESFALLLLCALLLTTGVLAFLRPLLYLFGASDNTIGYAFDYSRIYISGTVFVMLSLGMNYYINAQGFARIGMLTVSIGAAINIVLDPVFIFLLGMGIKGAAYATVLAQCCSAVWAMSFILGKKSILKLRVKNLRLGGQRTGKIIAMGTAGFVASSTTGLVQIVTNAQLQSYGGDLYVGAMTVINSVRQLIFIVTHGMSLGCQPVLGYNYGAGRNDRVKEGIRFVFVFLLGFLGCATLIVMLIPDLLTKVFNSDPELLAVAVPAMRVYLCGTILMDLQVSGQSTFVSLGKAKYAVFFSTLRKVLIVIPLVYLLPLIPGLGVWGVFWSEPVSDLLGGGACFVTMLLTVYRKLEDQPAQR